MKFWEDRVWLVHAGQGSIIFWWTRQLCITWCTLKCWRTGDEDNHRSVKSYFKPWFHKSDDWLNCGWLGLELSYIK